MTSDDQGFRRDHNVGGRLHRRPRRRSGKGLGEGGERLHYWVFGGPWTYDAEPRGEPSGEDAAWLAEMVDKIGAVVGGRATYEAAGHWGDKNPWGSRSSSSRTGRRTSRRWRLHVRVGRAGGRRASAGSSGERTSTSWEEPDVIRQALDAGLVDELTIIVAPFVLGGGKRLFEGFSSSFELEQLGIRQSQWATFVDYRVRR